MPHVHGNYLQCDGSSHAHDNYLQCDGSSHEELQPGVSRVDASSGEDWEAWQGSTDGGHGAQGDGPDRVTCQRRESSSELI